MAYDKEGIYANDVDLVVVQEAYHWMVDINGQLWGLTAGDQHYEESGIYLDGPVVSENRYNELKSAAEKISNSPNSTPEYEAALQVIQRHVKEGIEYDERKRQNALLASGDDDQ